MVNIYYHPSAHEAYNFKVSYNNYVQSGQWTQGSSATSYWGTAALGSSIGGNVFNTTSSGFTYTVGSLDTNTEFIWYASE